MPPDSLRFSADTEQWSNRADRSFSRTSRRLCPGYLPSPRWTRYSLLRPIQAPRKALSRDGPTPARRAQHRPGQRRHRREVRRPANSGDQRGSGSFAGRHATARIADVPNSGSTAHRVCSSLGVLGEERWFGRQPQPRPPFCLIRLRAITGACPTAAGTIRPSMCQPGRVRRRRAEVGVFAAAASERLKGRSQETVSNWAGSSRRPTGQTDPLPPMSSARPLWNAFAGTLAGELAGTPRCWSTRGCPVSASVGPALRACGTRPVTDSATGVATQAHADPSSGFFRNEHLPS